MPVQLCYLVFILCFEVITVALPCPHALTSLGSQVVQADTRLTMMNRRCAMMFHQAVIHPGDGLRVLNVHHLAQHSHPTTPPLLSVGMWLTALSASVQEYSYKNNSIKTHPLHSMLQLRQSWDLALGSLDICRRRCIHTLRLYSNGSRPRCTGCSCVSALPKSTPSNWA